MTYLSKMMTLPIWKKGTRGPQQLTRAVIDLCWTETAQWKNDQKPDPEALTGAMNYTIDGNDFNLVKEFSQS